MNISSTLDIAGATPVRVVTGSFLAKNWLDARGRARLAADLIEGPAVLGQLTAKQIIAICRTNKIYLAEARFPERVKRAKRNRLAKAFEKIDFDSRVELCRVIGAERVWAALAAAID